MAVSGGGSGIEEENIKEVSDVTEIFCILFGVGILVMQVHMFVKNHLTVHLRYVRFTLCHSP